MSKIGRPTGINYNIIKSIKITEKQSSKWDPKKIKDFLDGNLETGNIDTQILKKLIKPFIEYGVKIDNTTEEEDKRLMELIEQCL